MVQESNLIERVNMILVSYFYTNGFKILAPQSDTLLYTVGLLFNSTTYEAMLNGENMEEFINSNICGLYFNEIYLLTIYFYESV